MIKSGCGAKLKCVNSKAKPLVKDQAMEDAVCYRRYNCPECEKVFYSAEKILLYKKLPDPKISPIPYIKKKKEKEVND